MKKGVYFIIFLLLIGIMGAWAYRNSDMEQDILENAAAAQIPPGEPYETLSCPVPVSAYLFRDIDSIDLQLENEADLEWLAGLLDGTEISYVGETFTKSSETPPLYLVMPYENGDSLHIIISDANQIMIADNSVIDGHGIGCPPAGAYSLDTDGLFQEIFDTYEAIKHDEAHNALLAVPNHESQDTVKTALGELPSDYSLEQAKEDGCVTFEDLRITSGEEIWDDFLTATAAGEEAAVRLGFYYTLDPSRCDPNYYESVKDDYPTLYMEDLTFDGSAYTVHWYEDDIEIEKTYQYLMKYEGNVPSPPASYTSYVVYALTNDETVTWDKLNGSMLSSSTKDFIDFELVYWDLK